MVKSTDDLIWNIIGENQFCSFKQKKNNLNFCKNKYNLTGICFQKYCPLSNSKYATVIEREGVFFLFKKEKKTRNFPYKLWKKVTLSRNFVKAIQEINMNLAFWPKFFLFYVKKKYTKLTQILIRNRLLKLKTKKNLLNINKNLLKKKYKEFEILKKMDIEKTIEHELLNRLHLGIYGKLYLMFPIQTYRKEKIENKIFLVKNAHLNYSFDSKEKKKI